MIRAGSAVSDRRTAPRTDCSASRFWGGAIGPSKPPWRPPSEAEEPWPLVRSGALIGRSSLGRPPVALGRLSGPPPLAPQNCHGAVGELERSYLSSVTMVFTVAITPGVTST